MYDDCEHEYTHGGVKFSVSNHALSGTGAHERTYYDWFYCKKNPDHEWFRVIGHDTTYDPVKYNATPRGE
jgi:hypothetical protein